MPDPTPPPATRLSELSEPVFADDRATLYLGDAVELLPLLPAASIDSLVTDPPYGLSFNGQAWDDAGQVPGGGVAVGDPSVGVG